MSKQLRYVCALAMCYLIHCGGQHCGVEYPTGGCHHLRRNQPQQSGVSGGATIFGDEGHLSCTTDIGYIAAATRPSAANFDLQESLDQLAGRQRLQAPHSHCDVL